MVTKRASPSRSEVYSILANCQANIDEAPMYSALPDFTTASSATSVSSMGVS